MNIEQFMYTSLAVTCFVFVVSKYENLFAKVRDDNMLLKTLSFLLCLLSVGLVAQERIYTLISQYSVNNLAWVLTYLLLAIAFYIGAEVSYAIVGRFKPFSYWMLFPVLFLLIAFFIPVSFAPNRPNHAIPHDWVEGCFMMLGYLICLATLWPLLGNCFYLTVTESVFHVRLRWFSLFVSVFAIFLFFISRMLFVPFELFELVGETINNYIRLLTVIAVFSLSMFFLLTDRVFIWIAKPLIWLRKIIIFRKLSKLNMLLMASFYLEDFPYSFCIRNVDACLYRQLITILDTKRTLKSYLFYYDSDSFSLDLNGFNMQVSVDDARKMLQGLEGVDDHQDFEKLISSYSTLQLC